ncbi:MAG: HAD-IA family hydrolase [Anaerolineae bacterium]|nr:HAD-IA family hydrolase [Anaerolineae bacterium]
MIKAVLFDLDDTLISNPLNRISHSVDAWNTFFAKAVGKADAGQGLAQALYAVSQNTNPVENNFDVFLRVVTRAWEVPDTRAADIFRAFYEESYAALRDSVAPREISPMLLDWLRQRDYLIVIATNPLFLAEGVAERMRWGGLSPDFTEYTHVTHMQNSQFAKPTPHYYEEIAGRLGIATNEAIMIGDDWENDIAPAEQAGMNTFWVRPDGTPPGQSPATPDAEGTLKDFMLRAQQGWLEALEPRPLRPAMLPPRLLGNVGALFSLLREHAPERWWMHPDPAEWSPLEVVCHLRDSEALVQRPRLERIASEDNPFLTSPQDPPGPGEMGCETDDYCNPAEEFAVERAITVEVLRALPPEAWQRPARHSIFGPTTLLEMANFTATHDRLHLQQICQTIGRCE